MQNQKMEFILYLPHRNDTTSCMKQEKNTNPSHGIGLLNNLKPFQGDTPHTKYQINNSQTDFLTIIFQGDNFS